METLQIAEPVEPASPQERWRTGTRAAGPSSESPAVPQVEQRRIDALPWTLRAGFQRVLAQLPAAAWSDPQGRGGQPIKQSATRDVWRVALDGQSYYLKYYHDHGLRAALKRLLRGPACQAEWRAGLYALQHGIAAVRPLAYASALRRGGRGCSLLVTEAIEPAYSLHEFWQSVLCDDDPQRRRVEAAALTEPLAELIARAHQAGFEHLDMHAANLLVQPLGPQQYRLLFVDLQSARLGRPVSDRAVVRNLAQLNQWFRRHSTLTERLRFLRVYLRWRSEFETTFEHARPLGLTFEQLVRALARAAERHARRLWSARDRRVRPRGRYFAALRLAGGWRGVAYMRCKHPQAESAASRLVLEPCRWQEMFADPLGWFRAAVGPARKDSHSATVSRGVLPTPSGELAVIVKRPLARNWRRRLRHLLAPSRSRRGWKMGYALLNRDLPTARPLAYLERRLGPWVRDNLLITEAIDGARPLDEHLRAVHAVSSPRDWFRHKRALSGLLARQLRRLEERGFVHRDCKARNVLVVTQPALRLVWIDLDGMRRAGVLTRDDRLRALARLHVSLLETPGLTRTDRLRFLKAYLVRFGSRPDAWRDLWPKLSAAADVKVRRLAARRAWKLAHYGRV